MFEATEDSTTSSIYVANSSIDGLVLAFSRLLHQDIVVGIPENQSDLKNQQYCLIFPVYEGFYHNVMNKGLQN